MWWIESFSLLKEILEELLFLDTNFGWKVHSEAERSKSYSMLDLSVPRGLCCLKRWVKRSVAFRHCLLLDFKIFGLKVHSESYIVVVVGSLSCLASMGRSSSCLREVTEVESYLSLLFLASFSFDFEICGLKV